MSDKNSITLTSPPSAVLYPVILEGATRPKDPIPQCNAKPSRTGGETPPLRYQITCVLPPYERADNIRPYRVIWTYPLTPRHIRRWTEFHVQFCILHFAFCIFYPIPPLSQLALTALPWGEPMLGYPRKSHFSLAKTHVNFAFCTMHFAFFILSPLPFMKGK